MGAVLSRINAFYSQQKKIRRSLNRCTDRADFLWKEEEGEAEIVLFCCQAAEDSCCSVFSCRNCFHKGGSTGDCVSASIHFIHAGGKITVYQNPVVLIAGDAIHLEILKSKRQYYQIALEHSMCSAGDYIIATAGIVWRGKLHDITLSPAKLTIFGKKLYWRS